MPSAWDHKADKDLLLMIIQEGLLSGINWTSISERMGTKGYSFSAEACRQHYQKIRKESNLGNGQSPIKTSNKVTKTKSTPSSRGSKRTLNASFSAGYEDDDKIEIEIETPSKHKRVSKKDEVEDNGGFADQTAAQFKVEDEDYVVDLEEDELLYS